MKINLTKNTILVNGTAANKQESYDVKSAYAKLIVIGFQFILLFLLVFAVINTFAQAPTAGNAITAGAW